MEKHPFDTKSRISFKVADELGHQPWYPPTINEAGHLVQAQPRPTTRREEEVEEQAAESVPSSKQGYDDGFTRGKAEGLAIGKEEGLQQGKREAAATMQKELQPKLAELNSLLTSLTHSLNEEDYKLEQTLMQLVKLIAEGVLRRELQADPGQIMKVIKETISSLPPVRDNVKVLVNSEDKKLVDEAIAHGGENWRAVVDDSVSAGGCKIETDQSVADFSIENRIQTVLDQIYDQQLVCPKPGEPGYEEAPLPAVSAKAESTSSVENQNEAVEIEEAVEKEADDLSIPPAIVESANATPPNPPTN